MASIYLQVEGSTGKIFQYSKTEQEGYKKHTSSSGNVSFRKYYDKGLYGTMQNVSVRDSKIGEQLQVTVKRDGDYYNLQVPLYTQAGNIDNRYAESLIRFLPVLQKGVDYRFYPYLMEVERDGKKRTVQGVSVVHAKDVEKEVPGEKVVPHLNYSKKPKAATDIPNLVFKEIAGKNKPTAATLEAKNEFLYGFLKEAVDGHLAYEGGSTSSTEETVPTPKETPVVEEVDDLDSLPF